MSLRVGIAQIAPVYMDRQATIEKIAAWVGDAAAQGCGLVCFGETLAPGYPIWLDRTGGARFDDADQKRLHALYLDQAVVPEAGHLDLVRDAARRHATAVVLGVVERAADRGGHSLYGAAVVIAPDGSIRSVHRKLMPTHEERLVWGAGDGSGLVTHPVGDFTMGVLNCWENWMPLARSALYAGGEDLHVALWPGAERNTRDITRFMALEGRSYVISVCGLLRETDLPHDLPLRARIASSGEILSNGGSALAGPDGSWIIEPTIDVESLQVATLEPERVRAERQNLDVSGHYARPDVLELRVDRRRQTAARFID